jgi:hypothetical protein
MTTTIDACAGTGPDDVSATSCRRLLRQQDAADTWFVRRPALNRNGKALVGAIALGTLGMLLAGSAWGEAVE